MHAMTVFKSSQPSPVDDASTDREVVASVHAGAPLAYEVLVRRYGRPLFRALRAWTRDVDAVEDYMHDALLVAYRALPSPDEADRFRTHLLRTAVQAGKRSTRGGSRPGESGEDLEGPTDTDRVLPARAMLRSVEQGIDALPIGGRVAFVLRDVEGLHMPVIADVLNVSPNTVRAQLERSRRKLRRLLSADVMTLVPAAYPFDAVRADRVAKRVRRSLGGA